MTTRAKSPAFRQGLLVLAGATLVFALAAALECHSVVTASAPDGPFLPSAIYGLVLWGWWGLAAAVLWTVAENGTADFFALRAAMLQFLVGPALALAHMWMCSARWKRWSHGGRCSGRRDMARSNTSPGTASFPNS